MKIPTFKNTAETTSNLPAGYAEEDSPFFIHAPLRDFWHAARPTTMPADLQEDIQSLARSWAYERAEQEMSPMPPAYAGTTSADRLKALNQLRDRARVLAKEIAATEYDELRAVILHRAQLDNAIYLYEAAQRATEGEQMSKLQHECPVCGVYDQASGGVMARSLVGSGEFLGVESSVPFIVSCTRCHLVAVREYSERCATELLPERQVNRLELVRETLDTMAVS